MERLFFLWSGSDSRRFCCLRDLSSKDKGIRDRNTSKAILEGVSKSR